MPAALDQVEKAAQDAPHEPALGEHEIEVFLYEPAAALHGPEGSKDRHKNENVGDGDSEQKQRRHQRADHPADAGEVVEPRLKRSGGDRDCNRQQHHDGRMAEREEEAYRDRALSFLHQLAGHVVDGGDMIGVECVAQAERVGEHRRAEQDRVAAKRRQRPKPSDDVRPDQQDIYADHPRAQVAALIAEQA